jgi:ABC-type uncharacterized transport system YnjBCD substrate-binding protein
MARHITWLLVLVLVTGACSQAPGGSPSGSPADSAAEKFSKQWVADQLTAEGGQVNLFWPASAAFKKWQTETLNPGFTKFVKDTYRVEVTVNSLSTGGGDASFFQIITAYEESKPSKPSFSVDVVRTAPTLDLFDEIDKGWYLPLLPDYEKIAPNLKDINKPGADVFTRNGKLMAAPLYQPTIAYHYNADKVPSPPKNLQDLAAWIKANPQHFTYEDPRSGTGVGSGVLWEMAIMNALGKINDPGTWDPAWSYLRDIQPNIIPQPAVGDQMIEGFRRGDIWLMPFWNDWANQAQRDLNITFMKHYYMTEKLPLRNTPFAVPRGAAHPIGAILYVNFALSPEMQKSLGVAMNQIPASAADAVWKDMPANAFGFDFKTIQANTFAGFNSLDNVKAIDQMSKQFGPKVLGK